MALGKVFLLGVITALVGGTIGVALVLTSAGGPGEQLAGAAVGALCGSAAGWHAFVRPHFASVSQNEPDV